MLYNTPKIYNTPTIYNTGSGGGGGGGEIKDNFVLLKNGVNDYGLTPTSGSFGSVQYEEGGFIEEGETPYFAISNYTSDIIYLYDELKDFFYNKEWTFDFWLNFSGDLTSYLILNFCRNNNINDYALRIGMQANTSISTSLQGSSRNDVRTANFWHHIAVVKTPIDPAKRARLYIDGLFLYGGESVSQYFNDINLLRFRKPDTIPDCKIAQIALRDYAVWTGSQFFVPRKLYKQS